MSTSEKLNYNILDKEEILKMSEGSAVQGIVLIQNASLMPTKNGGKFISGNLQINGQISYKIWSDTNDDSAFAIMSKNVNRTNIICCVTAEVNKYGGTTSLIINGLSELPEDCKLSQSDFYADVYNIDQWWSNLVSTLSKNCSEAAYNMFLQVIEPIKDKFTLEFAAVKHHDACKSGLLAHTTKVTKMAALIKMYPNIIKRVSADLLFISCALHDVGKIYEYDNGSMSDEGRILSHHTFGVLYLEKNKETIVKAMGKDFYIHLLSVIEQHHGQYEERPRTIIAYLVHKIDELDSVFTSLDKMIGESDGGQIQYFEYKLI